MEGKQVMIRVSRRSAERFGAGDPTAFEPTDQRGEPRPKDGDGDGTATCDIGALEAQAQHDDDNDN
jgi:hypothetical protein